MLKLGQEISYGITKGDFSEKEQNLFEDFKQRIDGSYIGVGITVLHCEGGDNSVTEIFENSPAAKAGVKVGDIFLSIDGKEVRTVSLEEISKAIEGKKGASSEFVFLRDEKPCREEIRYLFKERNSRTWC